MSRFACSASLILAAAVLAPPATFAQDASSSSTVKVVRISSGDDGVAESSYRRTMRNGVLVEESGDPKLSGWGASQWLGSLPGGSATGGNQHDLEKKLDEMMAKLLTDRNRLALSKAGNGAGEAKDGERSNDSASSSESSTDSASASSSASSSESSSSRDSASSSSTDRSDKAGSKRAPNKPGRGTTAPGAGKPGDAARGEGRKPPSATGTAKRPMPPKPVPSKPAPTTPTTPATPPIRRN